MQTHSVRTVWTCGADSIDRTANYDVKGTITESAEVPPGGEVTVDVMFALASVKTLCIATDRDVTVNEHSIGPNAPLVWHAQSGLPLPFKTDVAGLTVENHGDKAANVEVRIGKC